MLELSKDRIEKILHEETVKKEEPETILRGIYTRYMHLFETYFADLDALNEEKIAELRIYHEETRSLVRYFYLDIPLDICRDIREFENKYCEKLLGPDWHKLVFDRFEEFRQNSTDLDRSRETMKAQFQKQILASFYETMDYVFREGFGTGSHTAKKVVSGITDLLFGKEQHA